ncbi:hypothetical protein DFH07DRAFT_1016400 [Mycena maculata]|uniref:Transmembrane protein n=1 Tax=Mycena maculata TaxID=230809 RepID=A0AAD7JHK0_9AGAR|nr:hypothetical protein DFH07DRAFT_1016400 [Mycena maculata]
MRMPRPPPLQLQFDNMFPGVRPRMQVKSLFTGVYLSNWRMLVLCLATINTLRFFLSAMDDLEVDIAQNNLALAGVSRTLATIYTVACGIELLGALGALLQRRAIIRAYAYLAFLSAAFITGAGVVTTAAYFTFADELLQECVALATEGQLGSKSLFRGDPWPSDPLSSEDAQTQCLDVWSSESVSQVVSAAIFYFLPSVFYCVVAYVYYCQTTDATHPASLTGRGSAIRLEARGGGAPYNALPDMVPDAAASVRPEPAKRRATVSPRSYQTGVAVAPVAVTSGSSLSPGPPSFSVAADPRAYQGFRLFAGPEDDTFI